MNAPAGMNRENTGLTPAVIGMILSPYQERTGMLIQSVFDASAEGTVEVLPQYAEGLSDLEGFERLCACVRCISRQSVWLV